MIHLLSPREKKIETLREMRNILTNEINLEKPLEEMPQKEKQYQIKKKDS